jgi:HEAT repeat protein
LERVSTTDAIKALTQGNVAPTRIWKVLEHGERVECLDCIPMVQQLLWDRNAKTREISAWWLRRRVLGVFGPGQAYEKVLDTLHESDDERQRAYAAEAIGEFLVGTGVQHVAAALMEDSSAMVRTSSAKALARLNNQGPNGELGAAMADDNEGVRLAALHGSIRINVFTGVDDVVARIDDSSPLVRRRAAEALGAMHAEDAVLGLTILTSPDTESDATVRAAAVASLGQIADAGGKDAVRAAEDDPDSFVRDAARIALRRF